MRYTYADISIHCSYPLPIISETSPSHVKTRKSLNNKEKVIVKNFKVN